MSIRNLAGVALILSQTALAFGASDSAPAKVSVSEKIQIRLAVQEKTPNIMKGYFERTEVSVETKQTLRLSYTQEGPSQMALTVDAETVTLSPLGLCQNSLAKNCRNVPEIKFNWDEVTILAKTRDQNVTAFQLTESQALEVLLPMLNETIKSRSGLDFVLKSEAGKHKISRALTASDIQVKIPLACSQYLEKNWACTGEYTYNLN